MSDSFTVLAHVAVSDPSCGLPLDPLLVQMLHPIIQTYFLSLYVDIFIDLRCLCYFLHLSFALVCGALNTPMLAQKVLGCTFISLEKLPVIRKFQNITDSLPIPLFF